jgi:putative ABC transport system permease protein
MRSGRSFSNGETKGCRQSVQMLYTPVLQHVDRVVYNQAFSLINIGGLSIGLASGILIILYRKNEVSFDRFHKKKSRI